MLSGTADSFWIILHTLTNPPQHDYLTTNPGSTPAGNVAKCDTGLPVIWDNPYASTPFGASWAAGEAIHTWTLSVKDEKDRNFRRHRVSEVGSSWQARE